ncbi:angiopoietin-related protein 4 [Osmerus eperlanus]|uniref:angiopoietin-related protein 4 n=1 Tax=Osmerus eperlanus TaxID=29151 RepID=UPI002E165988
MKISLACLTLLLAVSGFPMQRKGSAGGRGKERAVQYAAWEDVNVIAHGLLQLGQGLKEHVDKTKMQMRDISAHMKALDASVSRLGEEGQRLQEEGEQLQARVQGLEQRGLEERGQEEEGQEERRRVEERMRRLEEKVDGMMQGEGLTDIAPGNGNYTEALQRMLETQNKRIDDLVDRTRLQQEKLDKQTIRIRTLLNQIQVTRERALKPEDKVQPGAVEQQDTPNKLASDCHEVFLRGGSSSGVYTLQPPHANQPFQVYCHMTSDGGWTVVQNRQDGSVDFDQLWSAYQTGFGSLNGEFWLGLEKMYAVMRDSDYLLKIQFSDWRGDSETLSYRLRLGGEESHYTLRLEPGTLTSDPEGSLHSALTPDPAGLPFSTRDQDHDLKNNASCAKQLSGGWWFSNCGRSNLNGRYFQSPLPKQRHQRKQGMFWKTWRGRYYPLKTTRMMIAPAQIHNKS